MKESERITGNESESKIKDENNLTKIFHLTSKLCTYIMPHSFILLTLCLLSHSTHFRRPKYIYTLTQKEREKSGCRFLSMLFTPVKNPFTLLFNRLTELVHNYGAMFIGYSRFLFSQICAAFRLGRYCLFTCTV